MKTKKILLALIVLLGVNTVAESANKDLRVYSRLPLGEALPKVRLHDGWKINGDIFFYNQMVRCLKFVKKNCPEVYTKGKTYVKVWHQTKGGSWTNSFGGVWIGRRDYNFTQFGKDNWLIYMIAHEIQHNVPGNSCEGAANWVAVHYAKPLKLHPALVMYVRGFAVRLGYSASDWAKKEK
jgi:hypothetical protein